MATSSLKRQTLQRLLRVLVEEWGVDAVKEALEKAVPAIDLYGRNIKLRDSSKRSKKLLPHEMIANTEVSPQKREILLRIANRFEAKTFMPTIGDVREFFSVYGKYSRVPESRTESFVKILKILSTLTESQLKIFEADSLHAGPAKLAPLSDAINSAGEAIRSAKSDGDAQATDQRVSSEDKK